MLVIRRPILQREWSEIVRELCHAHEMVQAARGVDVDWEGTFEKFYGGER
jgi:hypothetical protein